MVFYTTAWGEKFNRQMTVIDSASAWGVVYISMVRPLNDDGRAFSLRLVCRLLQSALLAHARIATRASQ